MPSNETDFVFVARAEWGGFAVLWQLRVTENVEKGSGRDTGNAEQRLERTRVCRDLG